MIQHNNYSLFWSKKVYSKAKNYIFSHFCVNQVFSANDQLYNETFNFLFYLHVKNQKKNLESRIFSTAQTAQLANSKSKFCEKNRRCADSGFVKTCDKFIFTEEF